MPPAVAAVAASALSKLADSLRAEILSAPADDDEVVQMDNSLAYVRLIERTLIQGIQWQKALSTGSADKRPTSVAAPPPGRSSRP